MAGPLGGVGAPGSMIPAPAPPKVEVREATPLGGVSTQPGAQLRPPAGAPIAEVHRPRVRPGEPLGGVGPSGSTIDTHVVHNGAPPASQQMAPAELAPLDAAGSETAPVDDHSEEPAEANTADPGASQPEGLNEREQALWDVLASGSSDADAALETGYAEKTVQRKRTDWGI